MNILWIYYCPLIPEAGGTERMTSLIAKGLSKEGHNCLGMMVINKNGLVTYGDEDVKDIYKFLKKNRVDVVVNQLANEKWLLEHFLNNGGKKWHDEGGKIISCLHFDPKVTSTLYYFKSKFNKSLKDYYWILKSWCLYNYYDKQLCDKFGMIYKWFYENSDYFVLLSDTHIQYFKQVTNLSDYSKLIVINNPLTFDKISDVNVLNKKKKVVLVCARMNEYQKRISLILKAWNKITKYDVQNGWVLKIVGDGPDFNYYKQYVERNNLKDISFEGRKDPELYYEEASIFLMTSGYEGWGLTLTESLQKGVVPVVMNTSSVFRDIISSGYNGYLTKNNIYDFVSHIRILMTDKIRLRAMQKNALESASKFSIDETMKKWMQIIPNNKNNKTGNG